MSTTEPSSADPFGWGFATTADTADTSDVADTADRTAEGGPIIARSSEHRGSLYGRLWRGVPRELGFLLPTLPIVVVGMSMLWALFNAGVGTLIIMVGFFVVLAAMWVARGFASFELLRLRAAGFPPIPSPEWRVATAPGWISRVFGVFRNGHYWLALLHGMVVNFIVGVATWTITIVWVSVGFGGVTYWFYSRWLGNRDQDFSLGRTIFDFFVPGWGSGLDARFADNIVMLLTGILFLATLPFITHGLTWIHYGIARGMLGPFKSDSLRREVVELSASRGAAIAAEGHSLRRLERDIHDGPQQRLVRLQMDLAAAERQLDTDPARARQLIDEAMTQSREALDELRALSRGFAPPILLDRGLVAALQSAGIRSAVPVRVIDGIEPGAQLPQEIERNAYFVASEALANVAKHARATDAEVRVSTRGAGGAGAAGATGAGATAWLDVTVSDNGRGGATLAVGHGIAGLEQRLRGLGGTLEVMSPPGGPTVLSAHLPFTPGG